MGNLIADIARQQAEVAIRRAAIPAALGVVALVLFLFALGGLFVALFYWEEPAHGPLIGALIVAGVALILAVMAVLVLTMRRRPPPPPAPNPTMPQVVSLLAQTAPSLAPGRPLLTAVLLAVALGLMARGSSTDKR
jgi:Putative Actinobacterial Holin-X, holin superfamily III